MLRLITRFLAAAVLTIAVAVIVRVSIWGGPYILYAVRQPSISSQCAAIHAGMAFPEIEVLVHSKEWPTEERISTNQFSFSKWDTCQVDFDSVTGKVAAARMIAGFKSVDGNF